MKYRRNGDAARFSILRVPPDRHFCMRERGKSELPEIEGSCTFGRFILERVRSDARILYCACTCVNKPSPLFLSLSRYVKMYRRRKRRRKGDFPRERCARPRFSTHVSAAIGKTKKRNNVPCRNGHGHDKSLIPSLGNKFRFLGVDQLIVRLLVWPLGWLIISRVTSKQVNKG